MKRTVRTSAPRTAESIWWVDERHLTHTVLPTFQILLVKKRTLIQEELNRPTCKATNRTLFLFDMPLDWCKTADCFSCGNNINKKTALFSYTPLIPVLKDWHWFITRWVIVNILLAAAWRRSSNLFFFLSFDDILGETGSVVQQKSRESQECVCVCVCHWFV